MLCISCTVGKHKCAYKEDGTAASTPCNCPECHPEKEDE